MTDIANIEDWLRGRSFDNRQEAETYVLNHDGRISAGMDKALGSIYGEEAELSLENVGDFFENIEQQPETNVETEGFAQRLFNRLRGFFGG